MIRNKYVYLGLLIVLAVSGFVFYDTFLFQVWQSAQLNVVSDVPFHAGLIVKFSREHAFPAYTIWYRVVDVLTGFSGKYMYVASASILLLTLLVAAKYLITNYILSATYIDAKITALISIALIFVMPVISYYSCANQSICISKFHLYLGNIAPNQWHNSTLIFAMPFNLLLFYFSVKNIQSEKVYSFLIMGILGVISILCKPNYALAFLPVLCITIFIINIKSQQYLRALIKCSLVAVPAILTLFYQWYFTYMQNDLFAPGAKTIFAPFFVWSSYSPNITRSLLLSVAFPLLVLLFYFKRIDFYVRLSWLTFLVALFTMASFSEYPNWGAWNFVWGAIAANYILFLFSIGFLFTQPICWKAKLAYTVFGVHFLSGCFLLASFFIDQTSLML
ncbi:MAG: hypothetical protein ACXW1W_03565 [Methylococcaceae bacterium]